MILLYWSGVCFNLMIIISIFWDDDFILIANENKLLSIQDKIILLASCFLSWLVIPISFIKFKE